MASLLHLYCPDCGYTKDNIRFGPTFSDQRTIGPAFNAATGEILEVDYDKLPGDHTIVPYTVAGLRKISQGIRAEVITSYDHELWQAYNFCPGCNGYTLTITTRMLLD